MKKRGRRKKSELLQEWLMKVRDLSGMEDNTRELMSTINIRLPFELLTLARKEAALRSKQTGKRITTSAIIRAALMARYEQKVVRGFDAKQDMTWTIET